MNFKLFSGKNYDERENFLQSAVATVVTNITSVSDLTKNPSVETGKSEDRNTPRKIHHIFSSSTNYDDSKRVVEIQSFKAKENTRLKVPRYMYTLL